MANAPQTTARIKLLSEQLARFKQFRVEIQNGLSDLDALITRNADIVELTDFGLLLSELAGMLEDMRKESNARREFIAKLINLAYAQRALNDEAENDRVEGTLGWAAPRQALRARTPDHGTPEWKAFLMYIGLPEDICCDTLPLKIDWNSFGELVSDRQREGKPMPPGVTKTYPIFEATFRRYTDKQLLKRNGAHQGEDE